MTNKLHLGIVGANPERGWAKDAHIPALATIDAATIHAVSARNQEIADHAAQEFGAEKAFGDSIALTRDRDIDIVCVTVKVPEHYAIVMSALKAGKHVYCEWPLGRNVAEAEEMAALARESNRHVMIGLQGNFSPAVLRAAELIRQGAVGTPLRMKVFSPTAGWAAQAPAFYAYLNDKSTGATLATITGGHTFATIEKLVGAYTEVDARESILRPQVKIIDSHEFITRSCADHMLVIGKHASGCVSSTEVVGGQSVDSPFLLELYGTDGELTMSSNHPGGFQVGNITLTVNGEEDGNFSPVSPSLQGPPSNVAELYSRFVKDIQQDTYTVPNFDDAVKLSKLLEAIDSASSKGSRQYIS